MVKKIKEDGSPCRKCAEVEQRLADSGFIDRIDNIVVADERDLNSDGMLLAKKYQVDHAPFFIVEREGKSPEIYTIYFRFIKEIFNSESTEQDEISELQEQNPDLDYI